MADLKHCIGSEYKTWLTMMINNIAKETLRETLGDMVGKFEVCDNVRAPETGRISSVSGVKQAISAADEDDKEKKYWGPAVYIDETGKAEKWSSPSVLYKQLTGRRPSGSVICDGKSCSTATMVESFRAWGYIVKANGNDPPAREPGWSKTKRDNIDQAWKESFKAKGELFTVVNPRAPQVKNLGDIKGLVHAAPAVSVEKEEAAHAKARIAAERIRAGQEIGTSGISFVSTPAEPITVISTPIIAAPEEAVAMAENLEDIYEQAYSQKTTYPGATSKKRPVSR